MNNNKVKFAGVLLLIVAAVVLIISVYDGEKINVLPQHDYICNTGSFITYMTDNNDIVTSENLFIGDEISSWKDVIEIKTDEDEFYNTYKKVFLGLKNDGSIKLIIGDECREINKVENKKNITDIEVIQNYIFLLDKKHRLKVEDVEKYLSDEYDEEKEKKLNDIFKNKKIYSIEKNTANIITINNYGEIESVNIRDIEKIYNYVYDKKNDEYIKCESEDINSENENYEKVNKIIKIKSDMPGEIALDKENKIKVFGLYGLKDKIKNWENIKDIDYSYIDLISENMRIIYAVGLKDDGTIVSSFEEQNCDEINEEIKKEIESNLDYIENNWKDTEKIYTCGYIVVGVKENGEVILRELTDNKNKSVTDYENYEMLKNLKTK